MRRDQARTVSADRTGQLNVRRNDRMDPSFPYTELVRRPIEAQYQPRFRRLRSNAPKVLNNRSGLGYEFSVRSGKNAAVDVDRVLETDANMTTSEQRLRDHWKCRAANAERTPNAT